MCVCVCMVLKWSQILCIAGRDPDRDRDFLYCIFFTLCNFRSILFSCLAFMSFAYSTFFLFFKQRVFFASLWSLFYVVHNFVFIAMAFLRIESDFRQCFFFLILSTRWHLPSRFLLCHFSPFFFFRSFCFCSFFGLVENGTKCKQSIFRFFRHV